MIYIYNNIFSTVNASISIRIVFAERTSWFAIHHQTHYFLLIQMPMLFDPHSGTYQMRRIIIFSFNIFTIWFCLVFIGYSLEAINNSIFRIFISLWTELNIEYGETIWVIGLLCSGNNK